MPWKQGVQLEIDTRHFAASLTSHDFINEPLAPLEPAPPSSAFSPPFVLPVLTDSRFVSPSPPPLPPFSGETQHFSWDAILIAVLRLKRLLRSAITLRRTQRPYIPLAFGIPDPAPRSSSLPAEGSYIRAYVIKRKKNRSPPLIASASFYFPKGRTRCRS